MPRNRGLGDAEGVWVGVGMGGGLNEAGSRVCNEKVFSKLSTEMWITGVVHRGLWILWISFVVLSYCRDG